MQTKIVWKMHQQNVLNGYAARHADLLGEMRRSVELTDEQHAVVDKSYAKIIGSRLIDHDNDSGIVTIEYEIESALPVHEFTLKIEFSVDGYHFGDLMRGRYETLWDYFKQYEPESGSGWLSYNKSGDSCWRGDNICEEHECVVALIDKLFDSYVIDIPEPTFVVHGRDGWAGLEFRFVWEVEAESPQKYNPFY